MAPPTVAALPKYRTNQIPLTGSATPKVESVIFVGDWRELMIGMRTEAKVEVSRLAPGAFENLAVAVRVYLRADIGLRHPAAFCTVTGVGKAANKVSPTAHPLPQGRAGRGVGHLRHGRPAR